MTLGPLPGFRDFYPAEMAERAHIMRVWRDVARRFAFVEYDGPPLESLELYTRKSGDEIVGQLYSFTDKGDRQVALRPEMTPTVARMVGARANALRKPVRWFSVPQLFRYERAQKGRLREHFQLNVDIFGEADVTADAELVAVAIEIMRALGLSSADVRVRASDRRILTGWLSALGVAEASLPIAYAVIDKLGREPREVAIERLRLGGVPEAALAPILDAAQLTLDDVAARVAGTPAAEQVAAFRRFTDGVNRLTGDGTAWLAFDLSIVRGLAYYTGIVFELFDAQGEMRAICGGGRYDALLKGLGGPDIPALGFGLGDVVLGDLLRSRGLLPKEPPGPDFWVIGNAASGIEGAMSVAHELRSAGFAVEYALRAQKADKQLKAAQSALARYVIQLHEEFADNRVVSVRSAHAAAGRRSLIDILPGADVALDQLIAAASAHRGEAL